MKIGELLLGLISRRNERVSSLLDTMKRVDNEPSTEIDRVDNKGSTG